MKLLIKLVSVVVLAAVSFQLFASNQASILQLLQPKPTPPTEIPLVVDEPVVSKSELDAIFMYLPFLGFQFKDVVSVNGSDLSAIEGKRFVYESNVLEVYRLDTSSPIGAKVIQTIKDTMIVERMIDGKSKKFLGFALQDYICLAIEVNDPVALKQSYEFAKTTLQNLGIKFE